MKKENNLILAILGVCVIGGVFSLLAFLSTPKITINQEPTTVEVVRQDSSLGNVYNANMIPALTSSATSTGAGEFGCVECPTKILDSDDYNNYAIITNPSGTAVYLYVTTTELLTDGTGDDVGTATSSIPALDGIYLAASGGTYEVNADNLLQGNIYASSTASGLLINVSYY